MGFNTDLFIKDKYSGYVHRIGDDPHDSLYVDDKGSVHYYNLQNGDGCGSNSNNNTTLKEKDPDKEWGKRANEFVHGYQFVSCYKECQYCETDMKHECPFDKLSDSIYQKDNILTLFHSVSETMQKSLLEIMLVTTKNPDLQKDEWFQELGLEKGVN